MGSQIRDEMQRQWPQDTEATRELNKECLLIKSSRKVVKMENTERKMDTLSASITEFFYDPEHNLTFDATQLFTTTTTTIICPSKLLTNCSNYLAFKCHSSLYATIAYKLPNHLTLIALCSLQK
ncbi:unnamed protein product [Ceratitis capitata]|uniref:(Mediterranean fruit fly) hypothetical protein n=1 Tax=Ceratitis capitata TaxID=7213 RepID=A0A811UWH8_CERCA|nr:unnamed protein product [Ceratitis capitata]